jgi:hypothetical protein
VPSAVALLTDRCQDPKADLPSLPSSLRGNVKIQDATLFFSLGNSLALQEKITLRNRPMSRPTSEPEPLEKKITSLFDELSFTFCGDHAKGVVPGIRIDLLSNLA